MPIVIYILVYNIVPILIIIMLGFIVARVFEINVGTLNKLLVYLMSPSFLLVNLYTTQIDMILLKVLVFCLLFMITSNLLAHFISKLRKFDSGMECALKNTTTFVNSANIGLSLITLVYSSSPYLIDGKTPYLDEALSVMVMIIIYMNTTLFTVGFYNVGRATMTIRNTIIKILKLPLIYTILLALALKQVNYDFMASFFWPSIVNLRNALVPTALISLGAQLSKTKVDFANGNVYLSSGMRLIVGPVIAYVLIRLLGFYGVTAQTILIAYSAPSMVNTVIIAVEFKNNEAFTTQAVVFSTILSVATLTFAIYAAMLLFPV